MAAKKKSRWRRRALYGLGGIGVAVPALWLAIHEIPGFGPWLVDGVRAVVGPAPIAWAEDVAYAAQDQLNRWRYKDAAPKALWDEPPPPAASGAPVVPAAASATDQPVAIAPAADANAAAAPLEGFPPPPVTPPSDAVAAEGDGRWIPMKEPGMVKTVIHPDPRRNFTAVAVVAIDLRRIDLHLMAGTQEPQSDKIPKDHRPGRVPKEAEGDLVAAFNGGFKAMHGHWGMMLDGETFVVPRDVACTLAMYKDGSMKIRTWTAVKATEGEMHGYRQTPPCLVEGGKVNAQLDASEYTRGWGATVSGETVIRRSAIGLDASGRTLFYALGEAVTGQSLARAMKAIGAENAAQLDVNYSYPRFLVYERAAVGEPMRAVQALIKDIKFSKHEYVEEPSPRDFFYLTRRRGAS